MKRITFAGGSLVTSDAIASAVLEYTTTVTDAENNVTVDITVLEENGDTSVHTLLLSPASQFDVADVAGVTTSEEARRFPLPQMPQVGIVGVVEKNGGAARRAQDVDAIMDELDEGLGR